MIHPPYPNRCPDDDSGAPQLLCCRTGTALDEIERTLCAKTGTKALAHGRIAPCEHKDIG